MPMPKWIDDYIGKIVDERIAGKLAELQSAVSASTNKLAEIQSAVTTNTAVMTGLVANFDALINSIRNHTEALGYVADTVKALTVRVLAIENTDGTTKQNPSPEDSDEGL